MYLSKKMHDMSICSYFALFFIVVSCCLNAYLLPTMSLPSPPVTYFSVNVSPQLPIMIGEGS
jgi:hypothetical protein